MKNLQLKTAFTAVVLAALSFTACKKTDMLQPDPVAASIDSLVNATDSAGADTTTAGIQRRRDLPPAPTTANTFYISTSGNDNTGTGTATSPWRSLYKATSTVSTSGSIIHVNAGTYTETMTCSLMPGVSIEGDGVTSVLRNSLTADWSSLLALHSAEGTNGNQHISNIKFDGQNLSSFYGIAVNGRSNVSIHDITVVNFKETGVIMAGRADNADAAPSSYATGNSFYNNTILNCSRFEGYGRGNVVIGGQDGMLLYNNVITQNQRAAGNNGYCIKYVNEGFNKGCKIYNNTLTRAQSTGGDFDFAIELTHTSGLEVYNNVFNGGALDINFQTKGTYAYSVWIHDNQFLQPTANTIANQCGVILEYGTESAIIENNIFSKQNFGVLFTPRSGSIITDVVIRKNLMTGIAGGVWGGYYVTFGSDGNNCTVNNIAIYNNTLQHDPAKPFWVGINLPMASAGAFSNINIKNNIISGGVSAAIGQGGSIGVNNLTIQNNNLYNNGNNNMPLLNIAATGYVFSNSLNVVPTFGTNYTLPAGSPLINAGVNVGLAFNGTAPDIGYAEY